MGVGGGNFSVYWVWMPEQYHTECRGSALAFATCIGRFVAAGATFIVGIGISHFGSIGVPVALTSVAFVLGLLVIPFTLETMDTPFQIDRPACARAPCVNGCESGDHPT